MHPSWTSPITANSNDNSQSQLCDHQSRRMKLSTYMSSGKKGTLAILFCVEFHTTPHDVWKNEPNQVFFCLHSIQSLIFFTAPPIGGRTNGINLRLAMRGHFLHNVIEILDGEILEFPRGAPLSVSSIAGKTSRNTQGGAPNYNRYTYGVLFHPLINGAPHKERVPGGRFAPI